jgi:hypothetical protein
MISHIVAGKAGVIKDPLGGEVGYRGRHGLGGIAVRLQASGQFTGGKIAAGEQCNRRRAGAIRIGGRGGAG